jgi:tRNA threonylcarbamoyladenosine biosynthesis protein TsaB
LSNSIKLLAIDTSTDACSVALNLDGRIYERFEIIPRTHTRLLLPLVDALLKETNTVLAELDAFAFGRGPGSFTGIRIACSVIQALGFGLNKHVVPVSTLRALAEGALQSSGVTQVLAHLDAGLGAEYWGLFEKGESGIMQPASEEHLGPIDQIGLPPGAWQRVTGYPHAGDIARIAVFEYHRGHTVLAASALPVYLRDEIVKKMS